jgi:hypothetical protein
MTRASGRTQTCGAADARTRLVQARKFLEVSRQRLTAALRQARSLVDFGANVSRR